MLGTRVGSMDLNHHLTQPFRVWLGGWGGTKASLMLGTRVGSMDLNHHLTQPFRVWLGGWGGGTKASLMLGTRVGSMDLNHHLIQLHHAPAHQRDLTLSHLLLTLSSP